MEPWARPVEILLVEDNPDDAFLTKEAFGQSGLANNLHVVEDGVEALKYLNREEKYLDAVKPDIVLLDLNMPKKSGQEVLKEIKQDERTSAIPVVILTTSENQDDIINCYKSHANCYITKPGNLYSFFDVVKSIEHFWFTVAKLPALQTYT